MSSRSRPAQLPSQRPPQRPPRRPVVVRGWEPDCHHHVHLAAPLDQPLTAELGAEVRRLLDRGAEVHLVLVTPASTAFLAVRLERILVGRVGLGCRRHLAERLWEIAAPLRPGERLRIEIAAHQPGRRHLRRLPCLEALVPTQFRVPTQLRVPAGVRVPTTRRGS